MEETILGLDLSTTETGYCLAVNGTITEVGIIKPSPKLDRFEKIIYIAEEAMKLIKSKKVDELVIEDIYLAWVDAYGVLARLQGAMIYMWYKCKLRPLLIYSCTTARKNIGIKGNSKKKEVIQIINDRLGINLKNDNEADAIVLILNYLKEQGQIEVLVTDEVKNGRE